MESMDIGGRVVLVVSLIELETIKQGLRQTADLVPAHLVPEDTPENRPLMWQVRRASELLQQMPVPFKCESFCYAGPGHQSKHECEVESKHPIEGEHRDFNTEWIGTASYEMVEQPWVFHYEGPEDMNIEWDGEWISVDGHKWRRTPQAWESQAPAKRKLINTEHNNDSCGCRGRW
jgi:hypothetical protein